MSGNKINYRVITLLKQLWEEQLHIYKFVIELVAP